MLSQSERSNDDDLQEPGCHSGAPLTHGWSHLTFLPGTSQLTAQARVQLTQAFDLSKQWEERRPSEAFHWFLIESGPLRALPFKRAKVALPVEIGGPTRR